MKGISFKFIIITSLVLLASCTNSTNTISTDNKKTEQKQDTILPRLLYGINIDSLNVETGIIKKNEVLSDILLRCGINYSTIDYIAKRTKDTFDVRKIKRGNKYTIIKSRDTLPKTLYFIYEISPSKYVLYNLIDTVVAQNGKKEIIAKNTSATGIIKSSLWNSMINNGQDPNLANDLSEIYAWTIDFFDLKKGDIYKIFFTKLFVDGKYIGIGKIKATNFIHQKKSYYAFYFNQNGRGDYFDENGNSLERTFLKAPLKYRRISSRFTNSRYHPILKIRRPHHGVDYAAAAGTPVHSIGDGIIIKTGYQRLGAGRYIKIKHNSIYTTQYAHLRAYAKGIKRGVHVKQGQLIGYVGQTGLATGPHLDFRIFKNGKAINPLKIKSPPAKPIQKKYLPAFDSLVKRYKLILDSIK